MNPNVNPYPKAGESLLLWMYRETVLHSPRLLLAFLLLWLSTLWSCAPAPEPVPVKTVILQSGPLVVVGDKASLCLVAFYADGTTRLGKTAQEVKLIDVDRNFVAWPRTTDVRARCGPVLEANNVDPESPFVDVKWSRTETTPKQIASLERCGLHSYLPRGCW